MREGGTQSHQEVHMQIHHHCLPSSHSFQYQNDLIDNCISCVVTAVLTGPISVDFRKITGKQGNL